MVGLNPRRNTVLTLMTVCCILHMAIRSEVSASSIKAAYYSLYGTLVADSNMYKKEVRPADSANKPLTVFMDFELASIADVDEKGQMLVTSARLIMWWDDDYLSWNSSLYEGITTFLVPQEKVYLPDIVLANSVHEQRQLGYDELPVRITETGVVNWEPMERLETDCDIDIKFFPFETQKCEIMFETAISTAAEIDVDVVQGSNAILLTNFGENSQWELKGTKAETLANEGGKSKIKFSLLLKRRRTFYLLNIILPVFFLSLTASLVFALPADEGEKMGTSITVLLAFTVYLSIVAEIVPNTSLQVSVLALYLNILLAMSTLSTILSVVVLAIHNRDEERPIGQRTENLFQVLSKIVCIKPKKANNELGPGSRPTSPDGKQNKISPEEGESRTTSRNSRDPEIDASDVNPETDEKMTWQLIARTLDHFFFIFFSLATIVVTMICLLFLNFGAEANAPEL